MNTKGEQAWVLTSQSFQLAGRGRRGSEHCTRDRGVCGVCCGAQGLPQGLALFTRREQLLLGRQAEHTSAQFHCVLRSPLRQALSREAMEAEAEAPGPTRSQRRSLLPGPVPVSGCPETEGERRAGQGTADLCQGPQWRGPGGRSRAGGAGGADLGGHLRERGLCPRGNGYF